MGDTTMEPNVDEANQLTTEPTSTAEPTETVSSPSEDNAAKGDNSEDKFTDVKIDDKETEGWTPEQKSVLEKKYKSFLADYTRKTQSLAEERKRMEAEKAQGGQATQELHGVIKDILSDPGKYESYKKVLGPRLGIQDRVEEIPKLETVDDLRKYVDGVREKTLLQARTEVAQALSREKVNLKSEMKWSEAVSELTKKDPLFANPSLQELVIKHISDVSKGYVDGFKSGKYKSEYQVLEAGLAEFKSILAPEIEKARTQGAQILDKKKKSVTEQPTSKGASATVPARGLTREEIISQVQQELG